MFANRTIGPDLSAADGRGRHPHESVLTGPSARLARPGYFVYQISLPEQFGGGPPHPDGARSLHQTTRAVTNECHWRTSVHGPVSAKTQIVRGRPSKSSRLRP